MPMRTFVLLVCALLAAGLSACSSSTAPTDYAVELAAIDAALSAASHDAGAGRSGERAYQTYRRALLTGAPTDYSAADAALAEALDDPSAPQSLHLLRAQLDVTLHRGADAGVELSRAPLLAGHADAVALGGDIAMLAGRRDAARAAYEQAIRNGDSAEALARMAWLVATTGDADDADRLYAQAEDELTAKQMRSFAWIEVQRGLLAFRRGRHDIAEQHYRRADDAYSGYWLVHECFAELAAARRDFGDAASIYASDFAASGRPEAAHALGDLYLYQGDGAQAKVWHARALTSYLSSAQRGEVHYFHMLASFYADGETDAAQAVTWARRDIDQRQDASARDALAWALFRAGEFDAAAVEIERALPLAAADTHILTHAAMIDFARGDALGGKALLAQAASINPLYQTFHVHH